MKITQVKTYQTRARLKLYIHIYIYTLYINEKQPQIMRSNFQWYNKMKMMKLLNINRKSKGKMQFLFA